MEQKQKIEGISLGWDCYTETVYIDATIKLENGEKVFARIDMHDGEHHNGCQVYIVDALDEEVDHDTIEVWDEMIEEATELAWGELELTDTMHIIDGQYLAVYYEHDSYYIAKENANYYNPHQNPGEFRLDRFSRKSFRTKEAALLGAKEMAREHNKGDNDY